MRFSCIFIIVIITKNAGLKEKWKICKRIRLIWLLLWFCEISVRDIVCCSELLHNTNPLVTILIFLSVHHYLSYIAWDVTLVKTKFIVSERTLSFLASRHLGPTYCKYFYTKYTCKCFYRTNKKYNRHFVGKHMTEENMIKAKNYSEILYSIVYKVNYKK